MEGKSSSLFPVVIGSGPWKDTSLSHAGDLRASAFDESSYTEWTGLQESSLSVHDVMGVMELDLRRPGYGDSLAQTMASAAPADATVSTVAGPEADTSCARCRVLERQIKALSQALAGLGARVFNWTVQATLAEIRGTDKEQQTGVEVEASATAHPSEAMTSDPGVAGLQEGWRRDLMSKRDPRVVLPPYPWVSLPESQRQEHGQQDSKWHRCLKPEELAEDLFSDKEDMDKEIDKQRAILESLADVGKDALPPWASRASAASGAPPAGESKAAKPAVPPFSVVGEGVPFVKKAQPPPQQRLPVKEEAQKASDTREPEEGVKFVKPAQPPPTPPRESSPERKRRRRAAETPSSMAGVEAKEMHKYNKECLAIYDKLKDMKVPMEIQTFVDQGRSFDRDRFKLLTRPSRAATGLNYTRLMNRFLTWREKKSDLEGLENLGSRLGILDFVEHLMHTQVGYLTPRSFLYAVDYFATAFGYEVRGGAWNRARRLALSFAKSKTPPTRRAPGFLRATLVALERCVVDSFLTKAERVACGKLRLCIQASTRYDDILQTPIAACEWLRKPGEKEIIGLRSKALRGKSGPRLWVASLKGADKENDGWLPALVSLLLESHGATCHQDDHTGKLTSGDTFLRAPARLERDVELVKSALGKLVSEGVQVGLTAEEVDVLRWHGAKATLSSVMQHLNLPRRVVRWQGNWHSQADTMPDTYLRESQVLILNCQEKCLEYLRQGGDLVRLIGEPISPGISQEDQAADKTRRARAMEASFGAGADVLQLPSDLLDEAFRDGKIIQETLDREKALLKGGRNVEDLLENAEQDPLGYDPGDSETEGEKTKVLEEQSRPKLVDPQEALDEGDTEGLTPYWVQAKTPGPRPKVHLPSVASLEVKPVIHAIPRCGAAGNFELLKVEDALDPTTRLCRRCCPTTERGCEEICSHMYLGKSDLTVYRCCRRCECGEGDHKEHFCCLHSPGPKREGPSS
eukprot:s2411_g3.t1